MDGSERQERRQRRELSGRDGLSQARPQSMLEHGPRPAAAVEPVLPREREKVVAHRVANAEPGIQPDAASGQREAVIELGILVVAEARVVAADPADESSRKPAWWPWST